MPELSAREKKERRITYGFWFIIVPLFITLLVWSPWAEKKEANETPSKQTQNL